MAEQADYTYDGFLIVDGKLIDYKGKEKDLVVPDGVKKIGKYAIPHSTEKLYLPESVEEIDPFAFSNAWDMQVLLVAEGNPRFYSRDNCIIERATKKIIKGTRLSIIPQDGSVTTIGTGAFSDLDTCKMFIRNCITTIESRAFGYGTDVTLYIEAKEMPAGWADDWDDGCGLLWEETDWEGGCSGLLLEWGAEFDDDD